MNLIQSNLLCHSLSHIPLIAGQHHGLRNTGTLQASDRVLYAILNTICNYNRSKELSFLFHIHNRTNRSTLCIRNSFLIHQLSITGKHCLPVNLNLHAMTRNFLSITHSALIQFLTPGIPDRP